MAAFLGWGPCLTRAYRAGSRSASPTSPFGEARGERERHGGDVRRRQALREARGSVRRATRTLPRDLRAATRRRRPRCRDRGRKEGRVVGSCWCPQNGFSGPRSASCERRLPPRAASTRPRCAFRAKRYHGAHNRPVILTGYPHAKCRTERHLPFPSIRRAPNRATTEVVASLIMPRGLLPSVTST